MGEITDALRHAREQPDQNRSASKIDELDFADGAEQESLGRGSEAHSASTVSSAALADELDAEVVEISASPKPPWHARAVLVPGQKEFAERYRQFAHQVCNELDRHRKRSVILTSAVSGEGVTTTACNLALAIASIAGEKRVALVDLDLRRPSVARGLGFETDVGLESALEGTDALSTIRVRTSLPALDVFPANRSRSAVHELLASRRLAAALGALCRSYDIVLIDTPPVLPLPDVGLIGDHVDACIAVARVGMTPRALFREMLGRLPEGRNIGCFLNGTGPEHAHGYRLNYSAENLELPRSSARRRPWTRSQ